MKAQIAIGLAAMALLAASPRGAAAGVKIIPNAHADAYALVVRDQWMSTNLSIEKIEGIRDRIDGDFLWIRRHGKSWIARDREVLAQAQAPFVTVRALEPEQRDLARKQRQLGRKESALDRERDMLTDGSDDDDSDGDDPPARAAARTEMATDARMKELDAELSAVSAEERRLDAEDAALDRREEALESAAEAKLWALIDRWIAEGKAVSPSP